MKTNKSQCANCAYWQSFSLTYEQFVSRWEEFISRDVTPGHKKRYLRIAEEQKIPFDEVVLHYKTCTQSRLTRFYIMKDPQDLKPMIPMKNCPAFAKAGQISSKQSFTIPSPIWTICSRESHGLTTVRGCDFAPGLYEKSTYFRVPMYGDVKPEIVKHGSCSVCGETVKRGLEIRDIQTFCCNEHYLRWWQERHPDLFDKLNEA